MHTLYDTHRVHPVAGSVHLSEDRKAFIALTLTQDHQGEPRTLLSAMALAQRQISLFVCGLERM